MTEALSYYITYLATAIASESGNPSKPGGKSEWGQSDITPKMVTFV